MRKIKESSITLVWDSPQIPATLVFGLNFLTVAHSEVEFDVGVRNCHFEVFLVDSRMATHRDASTS
jgi:hypothetical protein